MSKKLTQEEFLKKATDAHGNKYDYSFAEYKNKNTVVKIICPDHGEFWQTPLNHYRNGGCSLCKCSQLKSNEQFINESMDIHEGKYDYSKTEYKGSHIKVKIICKIHGKFEQKPANHLQGNGCPKCDGKNKTTYEFIQNAKMVHGTKYDYSMVKYMGTHKKITIICQNHGGFQQTPSNHLKGCGCPKCSCNISKPETSWLDSLNILPENRNIKILKYKVDGYDPETNTVYEFHGDFWHGNPAKFNPDDINPRTKTTFGELYEKTILKEQTIIANGYNLVSIWESDFISK